ncbi:MAG: Shedu anti-phage system protein SduA domain-containing protein, partial [Pyrinomonadaceae bacterium]
MDNLEKRLLAILDSSKGERAVHSFLKEHAVIVRDSFSTAWNANIEVAEFCFGNDWRADFLLLCADSAKWTAIFIELEPPSSRLYLNNGTPSKALRVAQRQINDWKEWIRLHEPYLREHFSKILTNAGIGAQTGGVHEKAGTEILDPRTVIS